MKRLLRKAAKKITGFCRRTGMAGRRPAPRAGSIRSIACFVDGGIGDAIMAFPAIAFIRRACPGARLEIFVSPPKYAVLRHVFDSYALLPATPARLLRLAGARGAIRYDCVFTNTIAAFHVGAEIAARLCGRFCCGFCYPGENPGARLHDLSRPLADDRHDIDQNVDLAAAALGIKAVDADRRLPVRDLPPVSTAPPLLLIHPGAEKGYERKRWPPENYRALIERFTKENWRVGVMVGPAEAGLKSGFDSLDNVDVICPDPGLLVQTIRRAALFIGNDSGPAHLAAFYGLPSVTLIGPVDPRRSRPRGVYAKIIRHEMECAPCHFTARKCADNRCMKSITVDEVWNLAQALLEETRRERNGRPPARR